MKLFPELLARAGTVSKFIQILCKEKGYNTKIAGDLFIQGIAYDDNKKCWICISDISERYAERMDLQIVETITEYEARQISLFSSKISI